MDIPAAAQALQDKHAATLTALLNSLGGRKLTAAETRDAIDLLTALQAILRGVPDLAYRIEAALPRRDPETTVA
ncbi:MAG TPA: hypothetical protein VHB27_12010 [Rhodopila sp.]|uniref:hypothetical protein n=1 Tax=Rhodopila sp. TaxID=2480087 RepID=UPI002C8A9678|nr:hypothetical protein [Rhodopila sp.]HVY15945.1 hypothetical protein [Rhodopila sp.]